ncbi:CheY-like chemotaxis protein [Asanoa ferruginea]|uniref:CheY-like chemotaxis protein n=1 Tax=Asanoa ferruginea TaxID=53367 RepID=A0A3D9ZU95_9ACTN|nr:response regulator [Asanoa ferruginea]REG00762.1 CheY-like chemotaxis protein [Asanoa ferruginea]GIF47364.1 hypothetical protein Afe04nite_19030 [Asanoa ferruginea]
MTQPTTVESYRILVLDDEDEFHQVVRQSLASFGNSVTIDYAPDADKASLLLSERLYDLALLDVYGKDDLHIGLEVYRRIDAADLSTRVILMTRYQLKEDALKLLKLTGSASAWRLGGFLDKTDNLGATLSIRVGELIQKFVRRRASAHGLTELASEIARQRYRYKGLDGKVNLRKSKDEIATEVDRLLRALFVDIPGSRRRESEVIIELTPMERRGLSAAVVVNADVRVAFANIPAAGSGHRTVLKVGPKYDIFDEAARFHEYVRYGVELSHRVELLAVTAADALGGLVYSFAGGTYNHDLVALDEVLVEDLASGDETTSSEALRSLFARKDWYGTPCAPMDIGSYFSATFKTDLQRSCREAERQLQEIEKAWTTWPKVQRYDLPRGVSAYLGTPSGGNLALPDVSILGWGRLLYQAPACLVHGDMHGGNVLLECSRVLETDGSADGRTYHRSSLIDFRNSGPGPRCIDVVCLESSIRLADATLIRDACPPDIDVNPSPTDQANVIDIMEQRFIDEKALYRAVFLGVGEVPANGWARQCALVLESMKECFGEVPLREYIATSVRYAVRSLGFRLDPVSRLRMTMWLAAQYSLALELPKSSP